MSGLAICHCFISFLVPGGGRYRSAAIYRASKYTPKFGIDNHFLSLAGLIDAAETSGTITLVR
jgi:hypothetical protein